MDKLVKRSEKLGFYGVTEGDSETFHRMTGFTEFSKSSNPKEYSRQYVDEEHERSDIVGYSVGFSYAFDKFIGNMVHDDIAAISDNEATGADAMRNIVIVDMTQSGGAENSYKAVKRAFSVIPDSEGGSLDAYTCNGNFKVVGEAIKGTATSNDGFKTITFTAEDE